MLEEGGTGPVTPARGGAGSRFASWAGSATTSTRSTTTGRCPRWSASSASSAGPARTWRSGSRASGLRVGMIGAIGDDALADYLLGFLQRGRRGHPVRAPRGRLQHVAVPDRGVAARPLPAGLLPARARRHARERRPRRARLRAPARGCSSPTAPAWPRIPRGRRRCRRSRRRASGGARTVLDVDYRASSWPSPQEAGRQARRALRFTDVVIGNEDEIELLTGEREAARQVRRCSTPAWASSCGSSAPAASRRTPARGPRSRRPSPCPWSARSAPATASRRGSCTRLQRGRPLAECLRVGNAAAAVVVSRVGCSDAMPYEAELRRPARPRTRLPRAESHIRLYMSSRRSLAFVLLRDEAGPRTQSPWTARREWRTRCD